MPPVTLLFISYSTSINHRPASCASVTHLHASDSSSGRCCGYRRADDDRLPVCSAPDEEARRRGGVFTSGLFSLLALERPLEPFERVHEKQELSTKARAGREKRPVLIFA